MSFPMRFLSSRPGAPARARGFAIVSAIFLIVILAALGVAMLVFSNNQQAESGNDVQGSRAYQAAKTGIEWALYRRLNAGCIQNPYPSTCTYAWCENVGVASPTNVAMPSGTTLSQFTVTVKCTATKSATVQSADQLTGVLYPVVIRSIDAYSCITPTGPGGTCQPNGATGLDNIGRHLQVTIQQIH